MRRLSQIFLAALFLLVLGWSTAEAILTVGLPAAVVAEAPVEDTPMYRLDPYLGARPKAGFPDHDAKGWRNASAPETADIVALGDSHTYGIGTDREHAWPQQLAALTGKSVYQMAFGGYSPVHYLRMQEQIFALHPKVVIVAFYFGANFSSSYLNAYIHQPQPEIVALRSTDPDVLAETQLAHQIDGNWWIRAGYLDCQSPKRAPNENYLRIKDILESPRLGLAEEPSLLEESVAYRQIVARIQKSPPQVLPPPYCVKVSGPINAILSPSYRLMNLDDTDPRNVEGERLAIAALRQLADLSRQHGARFVLVLLPTKELAFQEHFGTDASPDLEHMARLWQMERQARTRITSALSGSMDIVDTLPTLSGMIAKGVDPYQGETADGHPSAVGYRAIAETIAAYLAVH